MILSVTIANGTSLSGAVQIGPARVVGIQLPTLTSAALTFQGSADGVTYVNLFDAANAEVTVTASVGDRINLAPAALSGVNYLKVRSGTSGAPVNQGADRVISLIVG